MKAALFDEDILKEIFVFKNDFVQELKSILQTHQPTHSILSSVINHPHEIEELLQSQTHFHKLNNESKLPFTIPVGKPETVGADRLAIAAACVFLFPGKNNLAIGLGSCITYNFINQSNECATCIYFPYRRLL